MESGDVTITIKGMSYVDSTRRLELEQLDIGLHELPKGKVFLYDSDLNKLNAGPYKTVKQAVEQGLGLKWSKVYYEYVNKDHLIVKSPLISNSVYLNTSKRTKPTLVHNITDNTVIAYDSMNAAVRSVVL